MSAPPRGPWWVALAVIGSAALALLAHAALVDRLPPGVGATVALVVPVAFVVAWMLRRSRHRAIAFAVLGLLAAGIAFGWGAIERHFPDLFFVEHAGGNLALAIVFGRTLAGGREALVTRFARLMHPALPPEVERYTRHVTLAWTLLFATLFVASCVLYYAGVLPAWSVLANIVNPIALVAMFVIEYVVRHRVLPDWERLGILSGVRAFSRHLRAARLEAPR